MGHHPGDIIITNAVSSSGVSAAPITWMLILIGVGIVGAVIYYLIKLKKI